MHEFILYSQVSAARHAQVLQLLAGVTASQPVNLSEQQVIYKQIKSTEPVAPKKGQTAQTNRATQLSYHKLVRDCTAQGNPGPWTLRKEEQPEPGVKDVISRIVVEYVAPEGDLDKFKRDADCFKQVAQFLVTGYHFVQGNVVVRIMKLKTVKQPNTDDAITAPPPAEADVKDFDTSGAYLIEASIRTTDESGSELRVKAKAELLAFAKGVEGAIDLQAPDRFALDTRVKGN